MHRLSDHVLDRSRLEPVIPPGCMQSGGISARQALKGRLSEMPKFKSGGDSRAWRVSAGLPKFAENADFTSETTAVMRPFGTARKRPVAVASKPP